MTTFLDEIAKHSAKWSIVITIEGVGDSLGLWRFCAFRPEYAATDPNYFPILMSFPNLAGERVDPLGGGVECGELSFEMLDYDDTLTGLIRSDDSPATVIDQVPEMLETDTTFVVTSSAGFDVDSVLWIGNEAVKVSNIASNIITVDRGYLGTDPQKHNRPGFRSRVFTYPQYLRSRRVRLYLVPSNASSSADEVLAWTGHLDGFAISQDTNVFEFRARSQLKYLDRLIYRANSAGFRCSARRDWLDLENLSPRPVDYHQGFNQFPDVNTGDHVTFARVGDEIVAGPYGATDSRRVSLDLSSASSQRGALSTEISNLENEEHASIVYVADDTNPASSFRFSPDLTLAGGSTPSTNRNSGTWTRSSHFVDILLNILTSSATVDLSGGDGLELVNFESGFANWSSLPRGIGAGIPVALVDVQSFADCKARTPAYTFPGFVLESESLPFMELAEKYFLRLVGAHLTTTDGKIGIILPRSPIAAANSPDFNLDNILSRAEGERHRLPELSISQDMGRVASSIRYRLRGPSGREVTTTITDNDYSDLFGSGGFYAAEDNMITMDAPAAITDPAHVHTALEESAVKKLRRFRRPQWRIDGLKTDLSLWNVSPGSVVKITHPGLLTESGSRGWSGVAAQVIERTPAIDAVDSSLSGSGESHGLHLEWTILGYGPSGKFGRVTPSAVVSSVMSLGATYKAVVQQNRVTKYDGADAGLVANDAGAFTVGDVLELRTPAGETVVGSGTETIESINSNDVELSGDFSGTLAADLVLVFSYHSSATDDQKLDHVYFADSADRDIGSSGDQAWQWGEP
ncbi:MAG: hypothetical protein CBC38_00840 [Gammaproteobacteria bacterium TMED78]|nr:MAG: hypothetical protein CBC38_00840 [Gammaproteobacteria bacterium TMED78]